jgi:hypothetical protein
MRLYKLTTKLHFGIYENEEMKFVYTFDPEYIEYLINKLDHFVIDINEYKDLHTCQIDKKQFESWYGTINVNGENQRLRKFLKEFTNLLEVDYEITPEKINKHLFSNETLSVLKEKYTKYKSDEDEPLPF